MGTFSNQDWVYDPTSEDFTVTKFPENNGGCQDPLSVAVLVKKKKLNKDQCLTRRLPASAVRLQPQFRSCGIFGGQRGTRADFFQCFNSHSIDCATLIYHPGMVWMLQRAH
jgi:hypothetical protein